MNETHHGYRLTDSEYRIVMDALELAEGKAVLEDAKVRIRETRTELMGQYQTNHD